MNLAKSQEIIIIAKVDNEIITNIDIEIEKKYLLLLNNRLKKLNEKEFFILAKNSLIREIIKKKEINKSFKKRDEKIKNKIIENFYTRLGFKRKNEFIKFLDSNRINFENLKEKLIIEAFWNQLIFIKFKDRIRIDKNAIELSYLVNSNLVDESINFSNEETSLLLNNDFINISYDNVDGVLVGSASLETESFISMIKSFAHFLNEGYKK